MSERQPTNPLSEAVRERLSGDASYRRIADALAAIVSNAMFPSGSIALDGRPSAGCEAAVSRAARQALDALVADLDVPADPAATAA